ncbi:MAG: hypothetical protein KGL48_03745 [Sphingomonadales bacterium]|nr:hypothetical protein [Sphingomonadales bacterium]MDE2568012.1 hypothetical protein [Sphingomonadales bacterium]
MEYADPLGAIRIATTRRVRPIAIAEGSAAQQEREQQAGEELRAGSSRPAVDQGLRAGNEVPQGFQSGD